MSVYSSSSLWIMELQTDREHQKQKRKLLEMQVHVDVILQRRLLQKLSSLPWGVPYLTSVAPRVGVCPVCNHVPSTTEVPPVIPLRTNMRILPPFPTSVSQESKSFLRKAELAYLSLLQHVTTRKQRPGLPPAPPPLVIPAPVSLF